MTKYKDLLLENFQIKKFTEEDVKLSDPLSKNKITGTLKRNSDNQTLLDTVLFYEYESCFKAHKNYHPKHFKAYFADAILIHHYSLPKALAYAERRFNGLSDLSASAKVHWANLFSHASLALVTPKSVVGDQKKDGMPSNQVVGTVAGTKRSTRAFKVL